MKGPQTSSPRPTARSSPTSSAHREAFPGDGFLGEETGGTSGAASGLSIPLTEPPTSPAAFRISASLSPLSTTAQSNRRDLQSRSRRTVLRPARAGATRNGRPIRVAPTATSPPPASNSAGRPGFRTRATSRRWQPARQGANVRRGASGALALAFVADGRSDGYAELHMNPGTALPASCSSPRPGAGRAFLDLDGLADGGPVLAAARASPRA